MMANAAESEVWSIGDPWPNQFRQWRSVDDDPPVRGAFVELSRNEKDVAESVYWPLTPLNLDGLFWRPATPPNFLGGVASHAPAADLRPPIDEDFWYVVLVEPQQEVTTVWRLHEQGRELYVPIIRRRVKTGRTGKNGQKVTRLIPKPMFPGYGFVRKGNRSTSDILATRGVRELLRDKSKNDSSDNLIVLPHEAVLAIFRKQSQKHHEFTQEGVSWRHRPRLKPGTAVRVDAPGNVYDGFLANIEKDNGKGRIQLLFGMIRHTLPADMVVAA